MVPLYLKRQWNQLSGTRKDVTCRLGDTRSLKRRVLNWPNIYFSETHIHWGAYKNHT